MTPVRIKENSWLARLAARRLGFPYIAMVFGRTIHLYNTTTTAFLERKSWVIHELKHVEQYEQLGLLRFLWEYAIESVRNGYWNNRFEIEARHSEQDQSLLARYDLSRYKNPL
jgi:hypothetical protein